MGDEKMSGPFSGELDGSYSFGGKEVRITGVTHAFNAGDKLVGRFEVQGDSEAVIRFEREFFEFIRRLDAQSSTVRMSAVGRTDG